MQGIDGKMVRANQAAQHAVFGELNSVARFENLFKRGVIMLWHTVIIFSGFLMNAVIEAAAIGNIDFLNPTTNAKNRNASVDTCGNKVKRNPVTFRVDRFIRGKGRPIKVMRFDIGPATG